MTRLALATRQGTDIPNDHVTVTPTVGDIARATALKTKYLGAIHRNTTACFTYNCHGLTFAARRTEITDAATIRTILSEDSYVQVREPTEVVPGDIIVYIDSDGDISHSGIVISNDARNLPRIPWVLSKWGGAHEIVHPFNHLAYDYVAIEYHRVVG